MTKRVPTAKKRATDRRGSVPMFVCAVIPAVAFMGIFTVRAANNWVVQARLQSALDAGALAAARDLGRLQNGTAAEKQAALDRIKALVAGIYNDSSGNSTKLDAGNVSVNVNGDKVDLSGTVNAANPATGGPRPVVRNASATKSNSGLELALVFDITLSMVSNDAGGGVRRIDAARDAGLTLLEVLYGDLPKNKDGTPNASNKKWLESLFVSVIPFATAVNYGSANTHFLGPSRVTEAYGTSWSGSDTSWGGCAEMRALSTGDATPSLLAGGLTRFYWPSTYNIANKYNKDLKPNEQGFRCRLEAAYQDKSFVDKKKTIPASYHNVCMGHNDWSAPTELLTGRQNTLLQAMQNWDSHRAAGIDTWVTGHGPNMMCPPETHRVLPLTRDRATIEGRIKALSNLPFSAGTNIAPGLMAGWFTLSPNWRKVDSGPNAFLGWSKTSEEPTTTTDTRPPLPALPLDYHLANRQKVLILLTDGDNTWLDARMFQGTGNSLVRPESARQYGFYGAYGYLGDQLGATSLDDGVSKVNAEAVKWCEKIRTRRPKERSTDPDGPEQITVYTISFGPGVSGDAQAVLQNCASKDKDGKTPLHFHAPNADKLKEIFTAIGAELSKLRLSQ